MHLFACFHMYHLWIRLGENGLVQLSAADAQGHLPQDEQGHEREWAPHALQHVRMGQGQPVGVGRRSRAVLVRRCALAVVHRSC